MPASKSDSYYVYNVSRETFISLGVKAADTPLKRLRGLLGKLHLPSNEGIWIVPSRGVHTIGLLFKIDLIYLDAAMRVVHVVESLGPFRFSSLRWRSDSVLELPARTAYASGTQVGDQLLICTQAEMESYLEQHQEEQHQREQTHLLPNKRARAV